jgi:1-acyl-sn-glycerol-3-phosphate acyltransferase
MSQPLTYRVQVLGLENLEADKTYFIASNHESHFDVPLIFGTLPFWLISVAKQSLAYIPVFGWAVAAGGTVWIDRKNTGKVALVFTKDRMFNYLVILSDMNGVLFCCLHIQLAADQAVHISFISSFYVNFWRLGFSFEIT